MTGGKPLFHFGPWPIGSAEVFFTSRLSYGLVNLKPVVPGLMLCLEYLVFVLNPYSKDVLVIPRRLVPRFTELSPEEVSDLWLAAQRIGSMIEKEYKAESLTLTIQVSPCSLLLSPIL